jgi:AcrR family transcriptional regulator
VTTDTEPEERSRTPLNRDRVLEAAITLADEDGLEGLSMRRLGQRLGVEAMSLYNHVANKDDLLEGIVDRVAAEFERAPIDTDWRDAIRQAAISAHQALLRHPWACTLMLTSGGVSPGRLNYMEWILATCRRAGFSPAMTHHAYHALDSHIMGFTLWVVNFPAADKLSDQVASFLRDLAIGDYPYLAEHIEQHLRPSTVDGRSEFEFGLDLILDGLERLRRTDE